MAPAPLGELEFVVLLVTARLGDEAYGAEIRREVIARTRRDYSVGAIYASLQRLEDKRFLTSRESDPLPVRGRPRPPVLQSHRGRTSGIASYDGSQTRFLEWPARAGDRPVSSVANFESHLLNAVLAAHPYGNAILGDLSEERAKVEAVAGADAARRWHRGEVWRSLLPIASSLRLEPARAGRLLAVIIIVYIAAIRATSVAGIGIEHLLGQSAVTAFVALYLAVIAIAGAIAGFLVAIAGRRHAFVAALFMIAMSAAIGAVHVLGASTGEFWFRLAKVLVFVLSTTTGLSVGVVATRLRHQ